MSLFKKKEKKGEVSEVPRIPELPQLPELPELPGFDRKNNFSTDFSRFPDNEEESIQEAPGQIPQLPSFPNGSLGNKFSQNTIKEAITGRKEEEVNADEFAEEMQTMQRPLIREETKKESYPQLQRTRTREAEPSDFANARKRFDSNERGQEPIFIRIDKFEEGSQTFEEVKTRITEIENMFGELKEVKEKEEKELSMWEDEIKQIKEKIDKIDNNIFSQIR